MGHGPQIALTPQTDERNFPRWEPNAPPGRSGHAYPRMLTRSATVEDIKEWREKNKKVDRTTREDFWEDRAPKRNDPIPIAATVELVDAGYANVIGEPVVAQSAEDEKAIREILQDGINANVPSAPSSISVLVPEGPSELEKLRAQNAELEAELKRREELKAALAEQPRVKRKYTRRAKPEPVAE